MRGERLTKSRQWVISNEPTYKFDTYGISVQYAENIKGICKRGGETHPKQARIVSNERTISKFGACGYDISV